MRKDIKKTEIFTAYILNIPISTSIYGTTAVTKIRCTQARAVLLRRAVKGAVCVRCAFGSVLLKSAVQGTCYPQRVPCRTVLFWGCTFGSVLFLTCYFRPAVFGSVVQSMLLRAFQVVLLHRAVSEDRRDVRQRLVVGNERRVGCGKAVRGGAGRGAAGFKLKELALT